MGPKTLKILCLCISVIVLPANRGFAQGPPPGGSPGSPTRSGGSVPGMGPGGPGSPGGPGGSHTQSPGGGKNVGTQRNALQFGPVGRWWDDKSVIRSIGLRQDQQKTMDSIFDANKPAIVNNYKAFLKAQSQLEAINKDPKSDKTQVFAAIDAVNDARSSLQKATSAMLLQIREQMDNSQIEKLEKLQ